MSIVVKNVVHCFKPDQLFTAAQYQGKGEYRYRGVFIVDPESDAHKQIQAEITRVAKETFGEKWQSILQTFKNNTQKICYIDGDTKPDNNGWAGNKILTLNRASDSGAPIVVDRDGKTPLAQSSGKIYSGTICNVKLSIWAQPTAGQQGIRGTLEVVQYVSSGPSLGGAAPASTEGLEDLGYDEASEMDELGDIL